jgi:hypothetical protein
VFVGNAGKVSAFPDFATVFDLETATQSRGLTERQLIKDKTTGNITARNDVFMDFKVLKISLPPWRAIVNHAISLCINCSCYHAREGYNYGRKLPAPGKYHELYTSSARRHGHQM